MDAEVATDSGAALDAGVERRPVLFGISTSGGGAFGWRDLANLAANQPPDVTLWGLRGAEASAVTQHDGRLILATDSDTNRILIWNDPVTAAEDARPDVTLGDDVLGPIGIAETMFASDRGDLWLSTSNGARRLIDGATGTGTTTVRFQADDIISSAALDPVGNTLFGNPDSSFVVAWQDVLMARGDSNPVTWSFSPRHSADCMVLGHDRLYVGSRAARSGSSATLRIWNNIRGLSGPAEAVADHVVSSSVAFAGYRALALTSDNHLVGAFREGASTSVHVYANADRMDGSAAPVVLRDARFDGLTSLQISSDGTLYGVTGNGVVVVPNVTAATPGTPIVLDSTADAIVLIE